MTSRGRKVILATDGSTCSLKALSETFKMLNSSKDTLDIITVVDNPQLDTEDNIITSNFIEYTSIADKIIDHCQRRCFEHNFILGKNLNTKILVGSVREEILNYIIENGPYDLVIVGSRGLGIFKKLMLGSVSDFLVNNCPNPVYIVRDVSNISQPQL